MDELLHEFLTETNESLDVVDVELVRFEQDPNNAKILANIFRLVHTIKGTCGFLGLPRLEALAHAAETVMGKFRDGMPVTGDAVSLILATIDRVKEILDALERHHHEPDGADSDLIFKLQGLADGGGSGVNAGTDDPVAAPAGPARRVPPQQTVGTLVPQVLQRALRPDEVSLDELERVFRETPGPGRPAASRAPDASPPERDEESEARISTQSIRVSVDALEHLMTTVSELVLTRNQLLDLVRRLDDSEFRVPLQRLSNVTAELQEGVMKTRMQPIGYAWQKLPRVVRDLSAELGKEIELELHGADTALDRQMLEQIKDPLTHMVRNSADHGIETPAERRAAGKPEKATIRLSAYHESGHIIVGVSDDGRGLDTDRIRANVVARGLASQAEANRMSDAQIHKFIFEPGFSTAVAVSHVSGRGVGMDVLRSNLDHIGGSVDVRSVRGQGVSFIVRIPLTLAIISALIVEAAGERFAIPQIAVVELVRVQERSEHRIERIGDAAVLRLRQKLLPLLSLGGVLKLDAGVTPDRGFVVVMQVGHQTFGVVVDGVFHTEEIVVKPMSSRLRHIALFSGNTILGDGSVIMILDPNGVAQAMGASASSSAARAQAEAEAEVQAPAPDTTSLLVFRAGSAEPKAIPLSLVTRLEEIDARTIERSSGRPMVQYRDRLMPLVTPNPQVQIRGAGPQPLLVFSDGDRSMGLVVDEIVDIVEDELTIQVEGGGPGVLGSAVVRGQATEILDVAHFLPLAYDDWFHRVDATANGPASRLLLVDDSPFFRNMLAPVLKAAGYVVTAAADGAEALAVLKAGGRFDVMVSDLEMPGMDGFSLAEAVRREPQLAAMPMIALSSDNAPETVERARDAGFRDHVAKFDRQSLVAALKEQAAETRAA